MCYDEIQKNNEGFRGKLLLQLKIPFVMARFQQLQLKYKTNQATIKRKQKAKGSRPAHDKITIQTEMQER